MKKILFFGDSITDVWRNRDEKEDLPAYGYGYVIQVAGELLLEPNKYEIINKGIGGDRIVDLYARVKRDVWNEKPDVLSVLIGINDVWSGVSCDNGTEIDRFENIYDILLKETRERLPDTRIILMEPFVLKGMATEEKFEKFSEIRKYAKVVKKLAEKYNVEFLPLQDEFDALVPKYGEKTLLIDGVHPNVVGTKIIAKKWLDCFYKGE